jgi:WD40 repeat protein
MAAKNKKPVWKKNPIPKGKKLYVNSIGISGDGQSVIAGNYFHDYSKTANHTPGTDPFFTVGTFLYSAKGALQWKDTFQSTEGVYWAALSRDGSCAASGGLVSFGKGFIFAYNAANGNKTLAYNTNSRVNRVALSGDGTYLVGGSHSIYLFKRNGANWSAPQIIPCNTGDSVVSVDISDDGQWIAAGTYDGYVMLIKNSNGLPSAPVTWQQPGGSIYWVAMASGGSALVAGARNATTYCFNTADFSGTFAPAWNVKLTGCTRCGCVAISADGSLVSAVGNTAKTGKIFLYSNQGNSAKQLWSGNTSHNPNSTSLDAAGKWVTVADGQPDGTPGAFYLYDATGNLQWTHKTSNMSWPMQISANATGIAAGSDDSYVYYFS